MTTKHHTATATTTAKTVKVNEKQLREFVEWMRVQGGATLKEGLDPADPVVADYRKRLKLGYEPLHKASLAVGKVPWLEHHAAKLQTILADLAALFKETSAPPAGPPSERPTLPSTRF